MSKKYSYSKKIENETFTIKDCDSLDEAIHHLEKAVYQVQNSREVQIQKDDELIKVESEIEKVPDLSETEKVPDLPETESPTFNPIPEQLSNRNYKFNNRK